MGFIEQEVMFEDGVRCVVMPCCGFTFDAGHSDDRSDPLTWSCPLCQPDRGAVEERDELRNMLLRVLDAVALLDPHQEHE